MLNRPVYNITTTNKQTPHLNCQIQQKMLQTGCRTCINICKEGSHLQEDEMLHMESSGVMSGVDHCGKISRQAEGQDQLHKSTSGLSPSAEEIWANLRSVSCGDSQPFTLITPPHPSPCLLNKTLSIAPLQLHILHLSAIKGIVTVSVSGSIKIISWWISVLGLSLIEWL